MNTVTNLVNVNEQALKAIPESSPTEKAMMILFAKRDRHTATLPIPVLKRTLMVDNPGLAIVEEDLYKGLEKMQQANLGILVHGKKGEQDVWKWGNHHIRVTRLAFPKEVLDPILKAHKKERAKILAERYSREQKDDLKLITKEAEKLAKRRPGRPKGSKNKVQMVSKATVPSFDKRLLAIPLKGNRDIKIEMPSNISQDELALINLTIENCLK